MRKLLFPAVALPLPVPPSRQMATLDPGCRNPAIVQQATRPRRVSGKESRTRIRDVDLDRQVDATSGRRRGHWLDLGCIRSQVRRTIATAAPPAEAPSEWQAIAAGPARPACDRRLGLPSRSERKRPSIGAQGRVLRARHLWRRPISGRRIRLHPGPPPPWRRIRHSSDTDQTCTKRAMVRA